MTHHRFVRHAALDALEPRVLYYALSGTQWASPDLTASFVPDGTALDATRVSALFAHLDAQHGRDLWQREFARALQTWAQYAPLNFSFVADDGSPQGTSGSAQGDPRFGDIRFGAMASDALGTAWYPSTTTRGGDTTLSTKFNYEIGSVTDLYSVLLHETGHALGLAHSADQDAVMSGAIAMRVANDLSPDDIAGIRALYGPRSDDAFDAASRNDSLASATRLSPDASGMAAAVADLTGVGDVDHYRITVPAGSDGTLAVSVDARGISLLAPGLRVYDADGSLIASASADDAYGGVATLSLSGLVAGQTYLIAADGASDDVFGAGAYRLTAKFGGAVTPTPVPTPEPSPSPEPSPEPTPEPSPDPSPDPSPSPDPTVEPDRHESNDVPGNASNLGRTSGFTQAGLSIHSTSDRDYFRFVPARNGTYVVSAGACDGMGLQLQLLDGSERVLASGSGVTLSLSAGQVYYINVADSGGACGSYNLSLIKTSNNNGGGKKGLLRAPRLAGDELLVNDPAEGHGHHRAQHGLSQAWSGLASAERRSAASPLLIDELEGVAATDSASA